MSDSNRDVVKGICDRTNCFFDVYTKEGVDKQLNKTRIYSSEETEIGKWIDGKPLYRKILDIGGLTSNPLPYAIKTGDLSIDNLITLRGMARTDTGLYTELPFVANINTDLTSSLISIWYTTEDNCIWINHMKDKSDYTKAFIILEYTKKTDEATINI